MIINSPSPPNFFLPLFKYEYTFKSEERSFKRHKQDIKIALSLSSYATVFYTQNATSSTLYSCIKIIPISTKGNFQLFFFF